MPQPDRMIANAVSLPSPAADGEGGPWRLGRALERDGGSGASTGVQWALRRNCSLAPRQLMLVYGSICVLSLSIASVFGALGATPVLAYAGIELLLVGAALLVYARHAADHETITLEGPHLHIEHCCGTNVERAEFRAAAVRVEPLRDAGSLLELSGQGRCVRVGRYLRPHLRVPLAGELRRALRAAPAAW